MLRQVHSGDKSHAYIQCDASECKIAFVGTRDYSKLMVLAEDAGWLRIGTGVGNDYCSYHAEDMDGTEHEVF